MNIQEKLEMFREGLKEENCSYDEVFEDDRYKFTTNLTNHKYVKNSKTNVERIDALLSFFLVGDNVIFEMTITPIFRFDENNHNYYVNRVNEINYFEAYTEKFMAAKDLVMVENNAYLLPTQNPISVLNTILKCVFADNIFDEYLHW